MFLFIQAPKPAKAFLLKFFVSRYNEIKQAYGENYGESEEFRRNETAAKADNVASVKKEALGEVKTDANPTEGEWGALLSDADKWRIEEQGGTFLETKKSHLSLPLSNQRITKKSLLAERKAKSANQRGRQRLFPLQPVKRGRLADLASRLERSVMIVIAR